MEHSYTRWRISRHTYLAGVLRDHEDGKLDSIPPLHYGWGLDMNIFGCLGSEIYDGGGKAIIRCPPTPSFSFLLRTFLLLNQHPELLLVCLGMKEFICLNHGGGGFHQLLPPSFG